MAMSLISLGLAFAINNNKPVKPMTTIIPSKEISIKEITKSKEKDFYITKSFRQDEEIPVIITFYENLYSSNAYGASGKNLSRGGNFVAAPMNVPFGTQLHIKELNKVYEVADRGTAIQWIKQYGKYYMKLDVYVEKYKYLDKNLFKKGKIYTVAKFVD